MTYQRLLNRNHLGQGGYSEVPIEHQVRVNTCYEGADVEFKLHLLPEYVRRLKAYEREWALLLGDLRRLEQDALDENALCQRIAGRTGVDQSVVAAVLKEFMNL